MTLMEKEPDQNPRRRRWQNAVQNQGLDSGRGPDESGDLQEAGKKHKRILRATLAHAAGEHLQGRQG